MVFTNDERPKLLAIRPWQWIVAQRVAFLRQALIAVYSIEMCVWRPNYRAYPNRSTSILDDPLYVCKDSRRRVRGSVFWSFLSISTRTQSANRASLRSVLQVWKRALHMIEDGCSIEHTHHARRRVLNSIEGGQSRPREIAQRIAFLYKHKCRHGETL